jgi:hypothetical protein
MQSEKSNDWPKKVELPNQRSSTSLRKCRNLTNSYCWLRYRGCSATFAKSLNLNMWLAPSDSHSTKKTVIPKVWSSIRKHCNICKFLRLPNEQNDRCLA